MFVLKPFLMQPNMEKIILTDADGVLVDWLGSFNVFMSRQGHPFVPGTETDYSLAVRHNISNHQAREYVRQFNESAAIADLAPFKDSVEHVKRLAKLGFKFIVVTSISNTPNAKIYRTRNLVDLFGDVFIDVHCIGQGESKDTTLAAWEDTGYFWIEDHMRQAEAGHEVGLRTILVEHPYNQHYKTDLFPKVGFNNPWAEIYNIITNHYNI